jgi:hypothetical protein
MTKAGGGAMSKQERTIRLVRLSDIGKRWYILAEIGKWLRNSLRRTRGWKLSGKGRFRARKLLHGLPMICTSLMSCGPTRP